MEIQSNQITMTLTASELDTMRRGLELLREHGVWTHIANKSTLRERDWAHDKEQRDAAETMLPQIYDALEQFHHA